MLLLTPEINGNILTGKVTVVIPCRTFPTNGEHRFFNTVYTAPVRSWHVWGSDLFFPASSIDLFAFGITSQYGVVGPLSHSVNHHPKLPPSQFYFHQDESCRPSHLSNSRLSSDDHSNLYVSPNPTISVSVKASYYSPPKGLWRRLLGADQASEEFPELAIKTLNVQERSTIDLSGFTENEVTRLIELIDSKVRIAKFERVIGETSAYWSCRFFDIRVSRNV